jgi:hypothetical protein
MRWRSSVFTSQMNSIKIDKMFSLLIDFSFKCFRWCFQLSWLFIIISRYLHLKTKKIWWSNIRKISFESNEAEKRLKWMSSYFVETKSESCWCAQIMQSSTCIDFSVKTFSSIESLIIKMFMSSMKSVLRRAMIKKYTDKNIDDWEFDVY